MKHKLSRLRELTWKERRLLLTAAVLLPLSWAAVHLCGLARAVQLIDRLSSSRASPCGASPRALAALVASAAGNLPFATSCLTRSLALRWLLRRQGVPSTLRIGVRVESAGLDAHAWVECGGQPLNATAEACARYAAFDALPIDSPAGR